MKISPAQYCFYLSAIFFVVSCTVYVPKDVDFKTYVTDTSISHRRYNEIDFSKEKSIAYNLPFIHTGVDSFELRIWVTGMMVIDPELIRFRYFRAKWIAEKSMDWKQENGNDSIVTSSIKVPDHPDSLVRYLTGTDILQFPSQAGIPGFIDNVGDGTSYMIEISTKNFYKALDYHSPYSFLSEKNNRMFIDILIYLGRIFPYGEMSVVGMF